MKIIASTGREDIAIVYIGEMAGGQLVECVEALQPPLPRKRKWVLLVSTMFGCPVGCMMCDAGGYYHGKPSADEIFDQIDYLVYKRYPDGYVPCDQFKIQFARMGEPALNINLLTVLEELPERYYAPGLMPSISTIAPHGTERFFERLLEIKRDKFCAGNFQFQFSIHTSDEKIRDEIIPVKKWSFERMAEYGERFFAPGDRKITLNFALAKGMPLDPSKLLEYFTPEKFLIKITPLNPTYRAQETNLVSYIEPLNDIEESNIVDNLRMAGYQVIVSIGEFEENFIGSNCGQFLQRHRQADKHMLEGYTYQIQARTLRE